VVCEVLARPKGLQAFRVVSMDESTAIHPAPDAPAADPCYSGPDKRSRTGTGEWFNRLRGFGFLTRGEGTPDIFRPTWRRCGDTELTELRPGQVRAGAFSDLGPKRHDGAEVRPESGPSGLTSH